MSSESTLILFGFLIIITPFLGLPFSWYSYILPILGLFVFGIGLSFRMRRYRARKPHDHAAPMHDDGADQEPTPHDPSPIA
ncbi:MAG: hypothetical protein B7X04_00495 [Parcubacteria group bacterium 21-54-25]|nr:MAG: hypothetical protein B7X04_00495 [Parcubacteria group bacterium 21-54-25]HQU07467.1 hypothetical protein [Candidatus Paceibacterota bacterium]